MFTTKLAFLVLAAVVVSGQALAVDFVQGGGPGQAVIVNLTTGHITVCPLDGNFTPGKLGPCVEVTGTLNVTGIAGDVANISLNSTSGQVGGEMIVNLTNGAYAACNVAVVNDTVSPVCTFGTAF